MNHKIMKDLILVFEDLNQDEKALAEAHLQECKACRILLKNLQLAEQKESPWMDLPPDPSGEQKPLSGLSAEEIQGAENSRRQLVEKVRNRPVNTAAGSSGSNWWKNNTGLFGFALAACLALFIWMPWQNNSDVFVQNFRMTTPAVLRGENSELNTGDDFVVRYQQARSGWPVVVQIVGDVSPELLFPNTNDLPLAMAEGRSVVLPPPGSPSVWTLSSEKNTPVFLISISEDQQPDLQHLKTLVDKISSTASGTRILKEEYGNCTVVYP